MATKKRKSSKTYRTKQYVWMCWYLGGTIQVLEIIESVFGVRTSNARNAIDDVKQRLVRAYKREVK